MIATFARKLALTLDMIKFQHSLFALPFALVSLLYATGGYPTGREFLLIVLCMVTARSAAMTFNRIVDRDIDALNPRTRGRALPAGKLSLSFSVAFCVANAVLFVVLSAFFNRLTLLLSPIALVIICGYSLTKRLTNLTQLFLGLALGIAPIASWIAVTGEVSAFPLALGAGVLFWVAGFDLIYSCQDYEFDRQQGLKNLVVSLGIGKALRLSRLAHLSCLILFAVAGVAIGAGAWYAVGLAAMATCLFYEQRLVKADDLSKVDMAFFTLNGYVALSFLVFTLLDIYL